MIGYHDKKHKEMGYSQYGHLCTILITIVILGVVVISYFAITV